MKAVTRLLSAACATAALVAGAAHGFPDRGVQLVVPYGTGPADLLARTMALCLSPRFKHPVIVVNRPGANALIGNTLVKAATPDGHTILLTASAAITDFATSKAPTFDMRRDLEPISKLVNGVQGMYVVASLPVQNLRELVEYAKARPGALNYATAGIGSVNHISTEAFSLTTGIRMTHIPFPQGTGAFLTAMLGGQQIQFAMTDVSGAQGALDTGKIRLVALLTRERLASRPDTPAVVETFPELAPYTGTLWYGFFAPPKTPRELVRKLHGEVSACASDAQTRTQLRKFGYEEQQIIAGTPEQLRSSVAEDVNRIKDIVQRAGIPLR